LQLISCREKEKADVENLEQPSVRTFLKQQGTFDKKMASMQKNYQEAVSRQETAEKVIFRFIFTFDD